MIALTYLFTEAGSSGMGGWRHMEKDQAAKGGFGYASLIAKPPPGPMAAQQKSEEALMKAQRIQSLRDIRRRKNPTAAMRAQGAY